ncbi:DUF4238 domain-containing protein [Streptomyces scabiei]|uniref:DUF4238 domain-containing protein n=1 Tax=Streptomyces scabiei TaxID=1930 RepID=UPI0029A3A04D|nr:DUF4238 domain-containing protein [Streptomyces scabiei]MDX2576719.1 DUF4238 domain-containing protein [Streptomyces scabiei]MDX3029676.1 DUF4238 domain-containing protein [Streptomyces scabiei]MDX3204908.1 DUF4238 domain-containing protein [Streptomyces scabiei]
MVAQLPPAGRDDMARIAELAAETDAPVKRQHLISQVLLAQFATPIRHTAGLHVQPHDLRNPQRMPKARTPRGVGWIEDFVPFASASLEQTWNEVEQHLPEAFASVAAGVALDEPDTVALLRDVIALHWVRSQHYRDLHKFIFRAFYQERFRRFLNEDQVLLQLATWEKTGLLVTGREGLALHAERVLAPMADAYESGALFRVRIEASFAKARSLLAGHAVQILRPEQGEFLIGDNPALTMRRDGPMVSFNMAIGDAHSVLLPISPRYVLSIGPNPAYLSASRAEVDELNTLQICAARRYVYTRPGSTLRAFIIRQLRAHRPSSEPVPRTA